MRKLFIFMLLCLCCMGVKAQNCSADTVKVNIDKQKELLKSTDDDTSVSEMYIFLSLKMLEDEYDVIYTDVPPHSFIASRGGKYYLVDILSGKEVEVETPKYEDNYSMIIP